MQGTLVCARAVDSRRNTYRVGVVRRKSHTDPSLQDVDVGLAQADPSHGRTGSLEDDPDYKARNRPEPFPIAQPAPCRPIHPVEPARSPWPVPCPPAAHRLVQRPHG